MRILFVASLVLTSVGHTFAGHMNAKTYAQLMEEADLVVIVHAIGWRPPNDGDNIVPLDREHPSLTPVFTKFNVLAVLKGDHGEATFEICHYKYRPFSARRLGKFSPNIAWFETSDSRGVRGDGWMGRADNDFMLFLKRDAAGRWTFVTGQYDAELSVRQITNPIRPGSNHGP